MTKIAFITGALFGFALASTAEAARDGWLWGWTVTVGNSTVCTEPYVWAVTREIECDRRR